MLAGLDFSATTSALAADWVATSALSDLRRSIAMRFVLRLRSGKRSRSRNRQMPGLVTVDRLDLDHFSPPSAGNLPSAGSITERAKFTTDKPVGGSGCDSIYDRWRLRLCLMARHHQAARQAACTVLATGILTVALRTVSKIAR